jgi:hypothetical protein
MLITQIKLVIPSANALIFVRKNHFENYILKYAAVIAAVSVGVYLTSLLYLQFLILPANFVTFLVFYLGIATIHHLINKDFSRRIFIEYLLIAFICCGLFIGLK